jgi:rhamnogalacturonan endolyase
MRGHFFYITSQKKECIMKQNTKLTIAIVLGTIFLFKGSIHAQRYMEKLDRAVIAVRANSSQVFISWRMFGTEPSDIGFNVYRGSTKLNSTPITNSTNYVDSTSENSTYSVSPVINGQEQPASASISVWDQDYLSVPTQIPSGGTTPDGVSYSYDANDCSVGDLDGDGEYEIVLKWDPTNAHDNAHDGYTGNVFLDAYKQDGTLIWRIDLGINIRAGAHYTQFMVYDLDSDGKAEVACKTADGTVDGVGAVIGDVNADYRNTAGRILSGPEFLTIFDGQTGAALVTTDYIPPLHPDTIFPTPQQIKTIWGDDYGNRSDRFLACIAYLDGERPSLVMCRGYYYGQSGYPGRTVLAAWNWRDGQLTNVWTFDTMFGPPENDAYRGQGNHNLSVGDVDGDGMDEIVYGACCIDHDGTGLYTTGLGHGDAMHLSDMDPNRPGLEVFDIHENASHAYGAEFRDAATGEAIWGAAPRADVGRGCAFDIDPRYLGYEAWCSADGYIYDVQGNAIYGKNNAFQNFAVWWDADPLREMLDGTTIAKWRWDYATPGRQNLVYWVERRTASNNGTKATPCLSGDILGDWREEVIWRTSDNQELLIFTTTIPTTNRIYTLMHDPQYRLSIAWQNVAYNQPPHTGFYLGDGMSDPPIPNIKYPGEDTPIAQKEAQQQIPNQFVLNQNFPNPFNPTTEITFSIAKQGHITLNVYNAIGQKITTLVDQNMAAGTHHVIFNAKELPSGVYFYQIKSGEFMQMKKMLLMK